MMRTDRAGDLRTTDIDRDVVVCGWVDGRRDHGGVVFLDVRDTAGIVQVVVDPEQAGGTDVHRVRSEYVVRVEGTVRHRPEGTVNDALPTGEVEVAATHARGAQRGRDAAVPDRRPHRRRRGAASAPPLPRPAPSAAAAQPARARAGERRAAPLARRAGLHRGRDADADRVDARGRARLRGAVAAVARRVLRAAAEPAAVQAAAHGRRHRPLLPDRPLPPRRGPARRPPVRVHAARRRDELRRRRRRDGRASARRCSTPPRRSPASAPATVAAHDLARGPGALRLRQARRALRHASSSTSARCSPPPSSAPSRPTR